MTMARRIRRAFLAAGALTLSGLAHGALPATYLPGVLSDGTNHELVFVDPRNPATAVSLRKGAGPAGSWPQYAIVHAGSFAPPHTYTDRHVSAIAYVTDNRLYRVSALLADAFAPTQVSSESEADRTCNMSTDAIVAAGQTSVRFLYALAGPGGNCDPAVTEWKLVRSNMGPGEPPVAARRPVGGVWDNQGRLAGWLAIDAGNVLKHYDADFGGGTVIASFSELPQSLGMSEDGSVNLLRIDDTLRAYNSVTRTLSGSLHAFATSVHAYSGLVQDSTHTYITDVDADYSNPTAMSTRILRVPSDGSAPATVLATEGGSAAEFLPTANRIVYRINKIVAPAQYASTFEVKSVAKTGGAPPER